MKHTFTEKELTGYGSASVVTTPAGATRDMASANRGKFSAARLFVVVVMAVLLLFLLGCHVKFMAVGLLVVVLQSSFVELLSRIIRDRRSGTTRAVPDSRCAGIGLWRSLVWGIQLALMSVTVFLLVACWRLLSDKIQ